MLIDKSLVEIIKKNYHARAHNNNYSNCNLGFGLIHYSLIRNIKPKNILVIGSQKGFIPAICGIACLDEGLGSVDFVDAGYSTEEPNAWGGLGIWKTATKEYWKPINCENIITIHNKKFEDFNVDKKYQYIYIDGDHSYEGVKRDFIKCLNLIESESYITLHDITVDKETTYGKCGVKQFWNDIKNNSEYSSKFDFVSFPFEAGLGLCRRL